MHNTPTQSGQDATEDAPYSRFAGGNLSLNDYLAIDRTVLANERTALAYLRTALAMLAVGGSAIKFFDDLWIELVGVLFMILAAAVFVLGVVRYRQMDRRVRVARVRSAPPPPPPPPPPPTDKPSSADHDARPREPDR